MSEFDYEYEVPVTAQESYDWAVNEPSLDDWFIELSEQGL